MERSGIRPLWRLCLIALCVYSRTTYGQVPTFDRSPCVDDIYVAAGERPSVSGIIWIIPLARDEDDQRAAVTCDKEIFSAEFRPGTNVVTCTAVDTSDASLRAQCDFSVHMLPRFEVGCPAPVVQEGTAVDFATPVAVGSGGAAVGVACTADSGDSFPPGQTTVSCTATDEERNMQATCSFDVTIGTPPSFDSNCTDYNVQPTPGKNEADGVTLPVPTATQADGGAATVSCRQGGGETTFPAGETVVACTAADTAVTTLVATCTYTVRVYPFWTRRCPDDTVRSDGSAVEFQVPTATDSVGAAPGVSCDRNSGDSFGPGVTTVSCAADDTEQAGQSVSCSFRVTIGEAPVFNPDPDCAQDVVTSPNSKTEARNVVWPERTANQSDGTAARVECTPPSGGHFPGGDTNVTCAATDTILETLVTTCTFRVRVYPKFTEPCPQVIFRTPDPDDYRATIAHRSPLAVDPDGAAVDVTCHPPWGSSFDSERDTVDCTAKRTATENATCVTSVSVAPSLDVSTIVADIDQGPDPGRQTAAVQWVKPTAYLPGEQPGEVTCTPASGSTFPPGESSAECVAPWTLPGSGSVVEAVNKFKVRVYPIITCPDDVVAAPDANSPNTTVDYPTATATDSTESQVGVDCVPTSGSEFANGAAADVTCNTTDSATGNKATCMFLVTVGAAPTFDASPCHEQVNVPPDSDGGTASSVSWADPTAVDRDNNTAAVTCLPASGTAEFGAGPTEVQCTAVDGTMESLVSICAFNVFVSPTFNVSCPGDLVVSPSEAVVSPDWLQAKGNVDTNGVPASVQCDAQAGAQLNQTVTAITCTAVDTGTELAANCSFTATIDSNPPVPTCPSDATLPPDPDTNTANHTWEVTATDDHTPAEDVPVLCIPGSGAVFNYGSTQVVCSAVDAVGNLGSCAFDVTVTGADCPENCTVNSVCTLNADGESVCTCVEGFSGSPCTAINECEVDAPCHTDADCTNLNPPDFFECRCKDGFYGDGLYSCERYIEPEYPNITGSADLEKTFSVSLATSTPSSYGCDPDNDKMSFQCLALVNTLKASVESMYRKVSPRAFKSIRVDQAEIRKGSVVIPHTVTYDYDYAEVRGMGAAEFLVRSTLAEALEAGVIGSLVLVTNCAECSDPKDVTDVCTNADEGSISCTGGRVPFRDRSADHCVLSCVSRCVSPPEYCSAGVCNQAPDQDPVCSDCPENTGGPRCEPLDEEGPNIPLIVGLSVGLGGGALLVAIGVLIFVCNHKTSKNTVAEFHGNNSRDDGVEAIQLDSKEDED